MKKFMIHSKQQQKRFYKESHSITIDGIEYKVDGHHVKIEAFKHEKENYVFA